MQPTDKPTTIQRPTLADARSLIDKMLDYEAAALNRGIDLSSSRFSKLTSAERQLLRAELVADYINLSFSKNRAANNFDYDLQVFCEKICDMSLPSHELIGTYLASIDIINTDIDEDEAADIMESARKTMTTVLQGCVDNLSGPTSGPAI